MHKLTKDIKRSLHRLSNYEEKLSFLENKFEGENCFIMAPGPSLNALDPKILSDKLNGVLNLSVKKTYLKYKDESDFHFINDCNLPIINGYPGYTYSLKNGPIVVASSGYEEKRAATRFASNQHWDIFCRVLDPNVYPVNNKGYLLENLNFEEGTFKNTLCRPCGPSLTFETVFYMAVHLGIKNIFATGLDGGTKPTQIVDKLNPQIHLDASPRSAHEINFKNWEIDIIDSGTGGLYRWLQSRGINLFLISDISTWNEEIPRISSEQLVDML